MAEGWRLCGGIFALLELIEEHRAALRYDWRTRFGKSLDSIPDEFGWSEAIDLVRVLRHDPSSQLVTSIEKWEHPLSREGLILSDLIDVHGWSSVGKKWKPYRRPFKVEDGTRKLGNAAGLDPEQVKARLRAARMGLVDFSAKTLE